MNILPKVNDVVLVSDGGKKVEGICTRVMAHSFKLKDYIGNIRTYSFMQIMEVKSPFN